MKIKEGFILREIAGSYHVIAVGKTAKEFNAMINLNQTGAFLWKILEKGATEEELVKALLNEYEVSEELAKQDVLNFTKLLKEAKLV